MAEGTDTILVDLATGASVRFGALGEHRLDAGRYAYVGSAFGPGGFARVDRHRRTASGETDTRHWHVDYLLSEPGATIADVVRTDDVDVECGVATVLAGDLEALAGVGCSDCGCDAHLFYSLDAERVERTVREAHAELG